MGLNTYSSVAAEHLTQIGNEGEFFQVKPPGTIPVIPTWDRLHRPAQLRPADFLPVPAFGVEGYRGARVGAQVPAVLAVSR